MTSVGSGSLMIVLLLFLYPMIGAKQLVGTDLVQAVPLTLAAALGALAFGHVEFAVTLSLIIGSVPAVFVGSLVSSSAPDRFVRPAITFVIFASGLKYVGLETTALGWTLCGVLLAARRRLARAQAAVGEDRSVARGATGRRRAAAAAAAHGRAGGRAGLRLLDVHPRDRARDHELLDLGGALEDVVDLGVAVPALDGELARVAVAAEDLDRALGRPTRRPRRPSACSSSPRRSRTARWLRPIHEARQTSSRAASISSFMRASVNAIAWFSMILRPNCSRSLA